MRGQGRAPLHTVSFIPHSHTANGTRRSDRVTDNQSPSIAAGAFSLLFVSSLSPPAGNRYRPILSASMCLAQTWPRLTLLVKSQRSISNAMGGRITRRIYAISLAFKRGMQDRVSARLGINQQSKTSFTSVGNEAGSPIGTSGQEGKGKGQRQRFRSKTHGSLSRRIIRICVPMAFQSASQHPLPPCARKPTVSMPQVYDRMCDD